MPVTIKPSNHGANLVVSKQTSRLGSAAEALPYECEHECKEVLQSGVDFDSDSAHLTRSDNGFIYAIIEAYNNHHHLVIRPEDVWFAILTQLSAYINANAEALRDKFVSHAGKKELKLRYGSMGRHHFDYRIFAQDMASLLQQNVVDPDLRDWILPNFSTTTPHDRVAASVVMMASLQSYFDYTLELRCGIPSVTLLGERADWAALLGKLGKLKTLGEQAVDFHDALRPVAEMFVASFDGPEALEVVQFWQEIVREHDPASGTKFYTGWIKAFCHWEADGKVIDGLLKVTMIPPGWAKVPVKLIDHGEEFSTVMVAGSTLIDRTSSGLALVEEGGAVGLDTVVPRLNWWIYETKGVPDRKGGSGTFLYHVFCRLSQYVN